MNVQAVWIVELPLRFVIGNDFKKTPLTQFKFNINCVDFELLKNSSGDAIERVKVTLNEEYDDMYLPSYENYEYLSEFEAKISYKASETLQSFLDGFSKHTDMEYYQVFDGQDFLTQYTVEISPNIMSGSGCNSEYIQSSYLDDETFNKSVEFASKEKGALDNAWYLFRDAEHSNYLGKYEISIINLAMMIELLVTSQLSNFLHDNGNFYRVHADKIKLIYGDYPSFVEKYFKYGLPLITNISLTDEILDTIDFIYKVRNKLAHGKKLNDLEFIKEYQDNKYDIKYLFFKLISDASEIYYYFYDLNN